MPRISEFFGIAIYMYYDDHGRPHFHARYAEHKAKFCIDTLGVMRGSLPRRARALVVEWGAIHRAELNDNWIRARGGQPLRRIPPLR
ncbi:MAG: DUF4160 domain-containing protein [Planctomycetota bacterium]|jgi:hypothetical protein